MEYFKYDYKNVKKELNFSNYENFITSMKNYKFYLFDLALLRYDPKINDVQKTKANDIIQRQKILFFLPYVIIGSTLSYHYKKNLFQTNMLNKELKIIFNLFGILIGTRIFQKGLLKFEADQVLLDIANNKTHSI